MKPWQFSKPKTPGFGISSGYYLSVLSATATMPPIRSLADPKGANGAIEGFAVPLIDSKDKHLLDLPMERGFYAIATKDRKTVLRLTVVSKEEAHFDPEAFARSDAAVGVSPEVLARVRATWTLGQLTFESHEAMVYPALDFFLGVASRLASLTQGVVGDAICQRYELPEQVFSQRRQIMKAPIYAEEHVVVRFAARPDGIQAYTLGLQKFAMPELEILNMLDGDEEAAGICLLWLTQQLLMGVKIEEGYQVGAPSIPFEVRTGGFDRGMWESITVWELLPPTTKTTTEAIQAWKSEILRTGMG